MSPQEGHETPIRFIDTITLGQQMTPEEAIETLVRYHHSNAENIKLSFMNLAGFIEGTVIFRESVNNGYECVVMEGRDKNGAYVWNHLLDSFTGQPMQRTG